MGDRELMDRIADFLFANQLPITQANLIVAHAAFSGEANSLARTIASRAAAGEAFEQQWLDETASTLLPVQKDASMELLAQKLERGIQIFEQTSSNAKETTREYGEALNVEVGKLQHVDAAGVMMHNLAEIARSMIERTTKIEKQMEESQSEAAALRASLLKARRDAELDHLTGLPNRRAFEGVFENQWRLAQAEIEPLSIAFCDIDFFKKINDVHGHDTGDRVIQAVAQVLARISDERCHVARHGGEEFVLLFRGISLEDAFERLDQTRESLFQRRFVNRQNDEPIGQVSFSGGIADVFAFADRRQALKAADEALYRAKSEGRNRIVRA
jgi:diguanylate cyclase